MGMAADHQVIRGQIPGQVFLLVGHEDPKTAQFKVQEQRKVLRPCFIVVSPDNLHRGDPLQLIQNFLTADIPAVEDMIAALQILNDLGPQKVVRIRNDSDLHR